MRFENAGCTKDELEVALGGGAGEGGQAGSSDDLS